MPILITIKPEAQAELTRQAAAHAVRLEAYAAGLLEEAAHVPSESKKLNTSQLDATIRELAQFSEKIPLLSDEALSRESIYRDHD